MTSKFDPAAIRAVLFDLDGTLIDVEMPRFIPAYVAGLGRHFLDCVPLHQFARVALQTVHALVHVEDGGCSNEERFLGALERHLGVGPELYRQRLAAFCEDGLTELAPLVGAVPEARSLVETCLERDLPVVIATNPVFSRSVIDARLDWGGLGDFDFELVTTLENSRFCKPSPRYFLDLASELGVAPSECLMVGNDTGHDLAACSIGMPTFLVDTWAVEREESFAPDYRGGHGELLRFLQQL
ncbi:MAG: HAD family hydrolase [Desulfuromonadales bacterium]|nr:HAD family hydrolase [Desulfuromonadales bacterium]NIR33866.1 HAD family hydrolase [Desulfuromonadales bacterium]NIS40017.1 HAD family hydrolase [Desulfuromonadales bacterium]